MTTVLAEDSFAITLQDIVRYAGASGDFTPIHYDAEVLTSAGYDKFFAMGMLTAGRLGALVSSTFGDTALQELQVRFREPAWLGSRVVLTIAGDTPTAQGPQTVQLAATIDDDRVIVDGTAVVDSTQEPK